MILTNKHNMAPEFVEAVQARQKLYRKGGADYSVTELLNSPRQVHLYRRHYDELEEDVSEQLSSWVGHLIHDAVEMDLPRAVVTIDDVQLSGATDYYKDGVFKDYKTTSVWTVIHKSMDEKWEAQLNMYAWLFKKAFDWPCHKLQVEAYLTDWQKSRARNERDYPNCRQFSIDIPLWSEERQEEFIRGRLDTIHRVASAEDNDLPECTVDERWERPTTYAIIKEGNKRATKVCKTMEEVNKWLYDKGWINFDSSDNPITRTRHTVDTRHGERVKCQEYCSQSKFCSQNKEYLNGKS